MSLFKELKRRNVFRVAVTYIVASWLLLQVTDVLMSVLGLPEIAGRFVFLLLVIGFVPALVFSWAYQMTPEGLKRDRGGAEATASVETARNLDRATIAMLVLVAGMVLADRFWLPEKGSKEGLESIAKATPDTNAGALVKGTEPLLPSIAVLPFANMSPDPDNEYFADGIAEELLNFLADIKELRVPSRTSSFAFKGQNTDIREIAGQLRVGHILEGSVRKAGNRVRVTAQLIDVTTDTHLWSETYDRELEDIFAIQHEIAGHIVDQLQVVLETGPREIKPTDDLEAYTLYLQGRQLFQQRGESLREAERLLLEAVGRDPAFAEAWATLAMAYTTFPNYLGVEVEVAFPKAQQAAQRALDLDSQLAEANLALGQVAGRDGRRQDALMIFDAVVNAHPGHSIARLWYGIDLFQAGYLEAALEQFSRAVDIDPTYGLILDWYARALLVTGHTEQAVEPAVRAVRLGRDAARVALLHYFVMREDPEGMQPFIEGPDSENWVFIPWVFTLREHPEKLPEALDWADSLGDEWAARPLYAHFLFAMMAGESKTYFEALSQVMNFDETVASSVWYPVSRPHRRHPAMQTWARDEGFVELWRARGWPDLCHPVGDDDFECE